VRLVEALAHFVPIQKGFTVASRLCDSRRGLRYREGSVAKARFFRLWKANSIYPLKEHPLVASPQGTGFFPLHRLEGFLDNGVSTAYQRVYVVDPMALV
jgi:hypothetical protein